MLPEEIKNQIVIVAPLDWGLGHASRCIPLIDKLIVQGNQVVFAGTEKQIALVSQDFPEIVFEIVESLGVRLDSQKSTYWQLIVQFKKMRRAVREEHNLAEELVQRHKASVIISDNRYGFRSSSTLNIFLTHQLNPVVPYFRHNVRTIIRKFISGFKVCWIPDEEHESYCGELLNSKQTIPVYFIGRLSRFTAEPLEIKQQLLGIVSGPEPERARFQSVLEEALAMTGMTYKIVSPYESLNPKVVNNPSSAELQNLINSSEFVVSRAGYTTIMELAAMNKKALLIPTKGQFEQEYLSKSIKNGNFVFCEEEEMIMELQQLQV